MDHCGYREEVVVESGRSTFLLHHLRTTKNGPRFDSCVHSRLLDVLDLFVAPYVGLSGLYHARNRRRLLDDAWNHHCFLLGVAMVEVICVIKCNY